MNIKLQTNEQLSTTVANGLAGVFVNGVSLSASLSSKADLTALQNYLTAETEPAFAELSGNFLTSVPTTYKTYASTKETLSTDGYLLTNDVKISYHDQAIWLSSKTYVTSVDCTNFIKDGMLSSAQLCGTTLVLKFNTDASTQPISVELSNFVDNNAGGGKVYFDNRISDITGSDDLSVVKLSADEYAQMLSDGTCLSNAIYIVEAPNIDAFKQRITNVASPTDLSDAATKEYVDNAVGSSGSGQLSAKLDASAAWPTWVAGELYDLNQVVSHNGKLWKANEPGPIHEPGSAAAIEWLSVDINSVLTSQYQPKGNYLTAVPTTYKTYSQTVAALSSSGYATSAQVNQKSTVSFNRITTTGTNIGSITIDGTTTQIYAPNSGGGGGSGSTVEVSADYQSGTKIATISVDSVPTSIYIPNSSSGSTRYALATAILQTAGNSLSCAVDDQTITTIQVSSSSTPIIVQLPAEQQDGARDFILRIEISSSTAPTFTFNGVNETIDFDAEDDDWAVMEPGLNLISFTETKRGDGSSSGNGGGGSNVVYHIVTFDPGSSGNLVNSSDATRQVADGEAVGTLPDCIGMGPYSFNYWWYTGQNGVITQVTSSTVITADVTFYAQYSSGGAND